MSWSQVSSNRWERPLVGMDQYHFYFAKLSGALENNNGREQYTIHSKVKVEIKLPDIESALKHAWEQARYEEPDIATFMDGETKVYEVPDNTAPQEWLDSTFIISDTIDAEGLYRDAPRIKQATLYYLPKSTEIVLLAHHYTIDGVGALMWWHNYLSAVADPKPDITFGNEHVRLAPSLPEVIAIGSTVPPTLEQSERATSMLVDYTSRLPGIGIASKVGKVPPGQCQTATYTYSPETTAAIVRACKLNGITVTSAVHAAFIRVMIKHADPESNTSRYTSAIELNLRDYLRAPYNKSATANYFTPLPFSVNLPASFTELVKALGHNYRTNVRDHPEILELTGLFTQALADIVKTPEYKAAPIPSDSLLSSLGVVEKYLRSSYSGTVVVKDFGFGLDIMLGMNSLHFYTFNDRLRLVYNYNDGYQDGAKLREYLDDMEKVLREELLDSAAA
ncbi:hypothetical protein BDW59DRAFT_169986 [Aspergillus cavernicola]|uniref:Condensation domain-containing protein n=1 Tax=Aspergillus cavernicola TaxID=176166 RepID=A0ABR4ISR7_9EURO